MTSNEDLIQVNRQLIKMFQSHLRSHDRDYRIDFWTAVLLIVCSLAAYAYDGYRIMQLEEQIRDARSYCKQREQIEVKYACQS